MSVVDTVGVIGELLSWIGGVIGFVLGVVAVTLRAGDRKRVPTHVTVVEDLEQQQVALWTYGDRTYSQPLAAHEDVTSDGTTITGYVAPRHPERIVLHRRSHAERLCTTLAIVMLSTGVVGFIASTAPLFW